jgi:hypothetical protein
MQRITMKTSTIFIGKGERTHVFHSVGDIPKELRDELEASTNGFNSATILIADRRGRQEIIRALNGLPTGLRTRLSTSLQAGSNSAEALATDDGPSHGEQTHEAEDSARFTQSSGSLLRKIALDRMGLGSFSLDSLRRLQPRTWAAILLPPAIGVAVWLALNAR